MDVVNMLSQYECIVEWYACRIWYTVTLYMKHFSEYLIINIILEKNKFIFMQIQVFVLYIEKAKFLSPCNVRIY